MCNASLVSRIGLYFSILLLTPLNFICQHLTLKLCHFSHLPHYPMESFGVTLWSLWVLFGSRGVPGSVPALCSAASALEVGATHGSCSEGRLVERCWAVPGPVGCAWCLNLWEHLEPSVSEAEGLSLAEGAGLAGSCCFSQHYFLGVTLVAQSP